MLGIVYAHTKWPTANEPQEARRADPYEARSAEPYAAHRAAP